MKHLFVSYEIAKLLKEKGFNEPCFAKFNRDKFQLNSLGGGNNYNDNSFGVSLTSTPLYQQVVDWFREKYTILIGVDYDSKTYFWFSNKLNTDKTVQMEFFSEQTYYGALDRAIKEVLKLI